MKGNVSKLTLQNKLAESPVLTRCYFPDYAAMLTRLFGLKGAVKSGSLADKNVIRNELISTMQMADKLGVYYDYANHTSVKDTNGEYGARVGLHGIGGGKNYQAVENAAFSVLDDQQLHDVLPDLKEGQVLLITKDSCLDLSDYLIAGETVGYNGTKIDYQWTIENDRAWVGERGVEDCGGAILNFDSFTDCCIVMGKNARLSGLCIQGPDRPSDVQNADSNFSIGIVVKGDGAVIENCEISCFFRSAIRVVDSKDVLIKNCYFHDISSPASGHAVTLEGSNVTMCENLFSNVTSAALVSEGSRLSFTDNVDAGNMEGVYFAGDGKVVADHNTFLSASDLFSGNLDVFAENNLFAYSFDAYGDAVSGDVFKNNVFDVNKPVLYSGKTLVSDAFTPIATKKVESAPLVYDFDVKLPVLSGSYYNEANDAGFVLLKKWIKDCVEEGEDFVKLLNAALSAIGSYTNYLEFSDLGLVTFEVDGQIYGAHSDGDLIGGGYGYSRIVTTGDYIVRTEEELRKAFEIAKPGEVVFLPSGTYINVSDAPAKQARLLTIPAGVTLASDRGFVREDGTVSTGAVIASSAMYPDYIMFVGGENVRITGLCIKGPDPARHVGHHTRSFYIEPNNQTMYKYYWEMTNTHAIRCEYSNVEFDNIELCGFNTNGIVISNKENPPKGIKVHHNYIHHCQIKGLGYGVRFNFGYAEVTHNMFNYNRHSISGGGHETSGYIAENNIEMGESLDHYYDMHGGSDRGDGTVIAGEYVDMRYNSFLGPRRPFVLRGHPSDHQDFSFNVVYDKHETSAPRLVTYCDEIIKNSYIGKNAWEISRGVIEIIDGLKV